MAHRREIYAHEFWEVAGVDQARLLAGARRDPRHGPAAQAARLTDAGHGQGATHGGLRGTYIFGDTRLSNLTPAGHFCLDGGAWVGNRGPANDPSAAPKCAGVRLAGRLRGDVSHAASVGNVALAASQAVGLAAKLGGFIADSAWAPRRGAEADAGAVFGGAYKLNAGGLEGDFNCQQVLNRYEGYTVTSLDPFDGANT